MDLLCFATGMFSVLDQTGINNTTVSITMVKGQN